MMVAPPRPPSASAKEGIDELERLLGSPYAVARFLQLETPFATKNEGVLVRCPFHGGDLTTCSLSSSFSGELRAICFACGVTGSFEEFVAATSIVAHGGVIPWPSKSEVEDLWKAAEVVQKAPDASTLSTLDRRADDADWLRARGRDIEALEWGEMVRVLPAEFDLPSWADCLGAPWLNTGHVLLTPLFGARGELQSFRAFRIGDDAGGPLATVCPRARSTRGLVMADLAARALLAPPEAGGTAGQTHAVTIVEPDSFLVAASQADRGVATLGVACGGWTREIASRIPSGSSVVVRAELTDRLGYALASEVSSSLAHRCAVRIESPRKEVDA